MALVVLPFPYLEEVVGLLLPKLGEVVVNPQELEVALVDHPFPFLEEVVVDLHLELEALVAYHLEQEVA